MLLKKVRFTGFRPFFESATLELEPTVTILTGANDAGKSSVLNTLRRFSSEVEGSLDDANIDFLSRTQTPWNQNREISALATYVVTSGIRYLHQGTQIGWEVDLRLCYTTNELQVAAIRKNNGNAVNVGNVNLKRKPRVIGLEDLPYIRTSIGSTGRNVTENMLLDLAFGENSWNRLESLDNKNRNLQRDMANEQLNERLARTKPDALTVQFFLDFESHDPLQITVGLIDKYGGRAFPHLRGAGYQKLMRLMLTLLTINVEADNLLILFDEPENSLHADAQHSFSRVLEDFAQHPNIQIVYATHSPAMINPTCPQSLRLLYRDSTDDGIATTRIDNKTYTESNYQSVRAQLGILPADSLMFASITVIVEGPTERLALNSLIVKIIRESTHEQHAGLNLLWRLSFVVGAGGSGKIPYWIEFAKGQSVKPIVLVDGDRVSEAETWKKDYDGVDIFHLDAREEFEDLVPHDTYIEALGEVLAEVGKANDKVTKAEFDKWWQSSGLPEQMMFSKRVDKWLRSEFSTCLDKPKVMDKAIDLVDFTCLKLDTIDQVIAAIRRLANDPK